MSVNDVLVLVGFISGWIALARLSRLPGTGRGRGTGSVSIIIPARNEASSLPNLLEALPSAFSGFAQVIVVDDESSDETADLARRYGATVVPGRPLPSGWAGKPWACHQGVEHADGEVLVFLDADVVPAPGSLDAVVTRVAADGGLVSVEPYHRVRRPYESLSLVFNLVSVMGSGAGVPRVSHQAAAFGPVLACRRSEYQSTGGHAGVRQEVAEDIALSERFRQSGLLVSVHAGRGAIDFRMYPDGMRSLFEGWTKSLATGASRAPRAAVALSAAWVTGLLIAGPVAVISFVSEPALWPVIIWSAFAVQTYVLGRRLGSFPKWAAMIHPVLSVVFVALFVRSAIATRVQRSVVWRGRRIELHAVGAGHD